MPLNTSFSSVLPRVEHTLQRQFGGFAQLSVQQDFVVSACQGVFDAAQRIHRHPRAERAAFAASTVARRWGGDEFFVGRLLLHFVQDAQVGRHDEFFSGRDTAALSSLLVEPTTSPSSMTLCGDSG